MTPGGPEASARASIDQLLILAGWAVQDNDAANLYAARGVAIREHPLKSGHGFADYLLYVDGAAVGVVEAKKVGNTLTGVETQAAKYSQGFPGHLPAYRRPETLRDWLTEAVYLLTVSESGKGWQLSRVTRSGSRRPIGSRFCNAPDRNWGRTVLHGMIRRCGMRQPV